MTDVNMGRARTTSSPSAAPLALDELTRDLLPALTAPATLERKAEEFADVVKSAATHWMDAVPVTLGQEFGGLCRGSARRKGRVSSRRGCGRLARSRSAAPAVGTGLNTHPEFAARRAREASLRTRGSRSRPAPDPFESQAAA